jgi:hypothetical protein
LISTTSKNGKIEVESKINLAERLATFDDRWSPKIVAQLNDYNVQVFKVKGEFVLRAADGRGELAVVSPRPGGGFVITRRCLAGSSYTPSWPRSVIRSPSTQAHAIRASAELPRTPRRPPAVLTGLVIPFAGLR